MPNAFPDTATLREVLELAAWAPSPQNSQPWHWQVDPAGLHLDPDWTRRLGDTESDRRDVLLSCGAVLNHCAVALAGAGWQPRIRRFRDGHLASFEVIERRPADADLELAARIARRRSDRRDYGSAPLPATTLELLLVRAARFGVQLSVVPRIHWNRLSDSRIALGYPPSARGGEHSSTGDGTLLVLATDTDGERDRLRAGRR